MVLQKNKKYFYLVCNTYKKYSKLKICTAHCINYYSLENKIIEKVKKILNEYNYSTIIDKLNNNINKNRIKKIEEILNKLYIDKLEEIISEDKFKELNDKYQQELSNYKNYNTNTLNYIIEYFNTITKKIIFRLINKIYVHSNKTIDVYFNFRLDYIAS